MPSRERYRCDVCKICVNRRNIRRHLKRLHGKEFRPGLRKRVRVPRWTGWVLSAVIPGMAFYAQLKNEAPPSTGESLGTEATQAP